MLNLDKSTWTTHRFGDVATNVNQYYVPDRDGVLPYVAGPHIDADMAMVSTYGSTDDAKFPPTFRRIFEPSDVLLHSRGIEKIAVVDRRGVTGEKLFVLRTLDRRILSPRFLPWLLRSPAAHDYFENNFSGSVNKFLNWRPLANFELSLPPMGEQERIADLLWSIEHTAIAMLRLQSAVSGLADKWIEDWWPSATHSRIGEVGRCVTGSTPSKTDPSLWIPGTVPFLTPTQVQGTYAAPPAQWISHLGAARSRCLPPHSVLVVCIGGDMGRASVQVDPAATNQQITAVTGLDETDALLLRRLLVHPLGRRATAERETTTIVRKLNKSDLMKVTVPWGPHRSRAVHLTLSEADALETAEAELEGLRALRNAVLCETYGDA